MRSSGQLNLSIFRAPRFAEGDFRHAASNADAWAWLGRTPEWPDHRLALWGESAGASLIADVLHLWPDVEERRWIRQARVIGNGRGFVGRRLTARVPPDGARSRREHQTEKRCK